MRSVYHLRRSDREITDRQQIQSIISRGRFITIALVDGEEPYVVTLSYGYDSDARRLYFHAAHAGRKMDVILRNPKACGTIVIAPEYTEGECEHPFESLVIHGNMRIVADEQEKLHAIRTLVNHLEGDPDSYWATRSWDVSERIGGFTALALEIQGVSGKQGK